MSTTEYSGGFKDGEYEGYGELKGSTKGQTLQYKGHFKNGYFHGQGDLLLDEDFYENLNWKNSTLAAHKSTILRMKPIKLLDVKMQDGRYVLEMQTKLTDGSEVTWKPYDYIGNIFGK